MPLYSFTCLDCQKNFDKMSRMDDRDKPRECECGSMNTQRLMDVPRGYKIDGGIHAQLEKANGGDGVVGVTRDRDWLDDYA